MTVLLDRGLECPAEADLPERVENHAGTIVCHILGSRPFSNIGSRLGIEAIAQRTTPVANRGDDMRLHSPERLIGKSMGYDPFLSRVDVPVDRIEDADAVEAGVPR